MSKFTRGFSIDMDLEEPIKKITNVSGLVNSFLRDLIDNGSMMKELEIKKELVEIQAIKAKTDTREINLKKQLLLIKDKDQRIKDKFSNIPEEILTIFKCSDKLTEDILHKRYLQVDKGDEQHGFKSMYPDLTWEELKEAFTAFKSGEFQ